MGNGIDRLREEWHKVKKTTSFHNVVLYLVFVAISTLFWYIMALNDSAQESFNIKVSINNCPDSITFISDIPEKIHVNVRDKGTVLWRTHYRRPTININFKEYASGGRLKFGHTDLVTSLKGIFGTSAQIMSTSVDSIYLNYTSNKGKRVPVVVEGRFETVSGKVIDGHIKPRPSNVLIYGEQNVLDTIHRVYTSDIISRDLTETKTMTVELRRIPGVRIIPSTVDVTIPVEPLVRKEAYISISTVNVPRGESLLLFPSKVPVEYYVAMSRLGDDDDPEIELQVDYNYLRNYGSRKLPVNVVRYPGRLQNLSLKTDSVEYSVVRN